MSRASHCVEVRYQYVLSCENSYQEGVERCTLVKSTIRDAFICVITLEQHGILWKEKNYREVRGVIIKFVDRRRKTLVTQSISLIFTLATITYKCKMYLKLRREILRNKINMTFYRIKCIAARRPVYL